MSSCPARLLKILLVATRPRFARNQVAEEFRAYLDYTIRGGRCVPGIVSFTLNETQRGLFSTISFVLAHASFALDVDESPSTTSLLAYFIMVTYSLFSCFVLDSDRSPQAPNPDWADPRLFFPISHLLHYPHEHASEYKNRHSPLG